MAAGPQALAEAETVYCLGYSLPPMDLLVASLLAEPLRDKHVMVVDRDDSVGARFKALSRPATVDVDWCSEKDPIAAFAGWYAARSESPMSGCPPPTAPSGSG